MPTLRITTPEESGDYQIFRVIDVHRAPDGRVLVSNGGSSEVLAFGPEGQFLQSYGRRGGGPGEFRVPGELWTRGDTLVAYDVRNGRTGSIFAYDTAGGVVRTARFDADVQGGGWILLGRFADGSLLFKSDHYFFRGDMTRDSIALHRFEPDWNERSQVLRVPHTYSYRITVAGKEEVGNNPLSTPASVAVGPDEFYATGDGYEVRVYSPAGELRKIFRLDRPARPITDAEKQEYRDWLVRQFPSAAENPSFDRKLGEVRYPDALPGYSTVLLDALGFVWAEEYRISKDQPSTWHVYDPAGVLTASVRIPPGVRVVEVGEDEVLAVVVDELGVESVASFPLERGSLHSPAS